jgi:hypothetical protein
MTPLRMHCSVVCTNDHIQIAVNAQKTAARCIESVRADKGWILSHRYDRVWAGKGYDQFDIFWVWKVAVLLAFLEVLRIGS